MIGSIVEGEGDQKAVPILLNKYFRVVLQREDVSAYKEAKPGGCKSKLCKRLEALLTEVAAYASAILIVLDADDEQDYPGCHAQEIAEEVRRITNGKYVCPIGIVVATRAYEAWLVASIESIAKKHPRVIAQNATCPSNPDAIENPEGWLKNKCPDKKNQYHKTSHQARMSEHIDFDKAKRSKSFQKLLKRVDEIVEVATKNQRGEVKRGYVMPLS
jgi:hypothetical protein